jgi:hypothetical protein
MIAEKRYTVYFLIRSDAMRALKKEAYKRDVAISKLVRKTLEEAKLLPAKERKRL